MADDDDERKDKLGASLGIKRRKKGGEASTEGGEEAAKPKKGLKLGFKRRKGADAEGKGEEKKAGGSSLGLGIKRRSGAPAEAGDPEAESAEEAAAAALAADPLAPWRSKLGNDQTAVMLGNLFKTRPDLPAKLPERVWDLHRTHGRYLGDGRPERVIWVGFEPALVVFSIPSYPDGPPTFTKGWEIIEPGVNRQPKFVESGFEVKAPYNTLGEWYVYIVWSSDGEPIGVPEATQADAGKKTKKGRGDVRSGLGIKRRK